MLEYKGNYAKRQAGRFHLQNRNCNDCKLLGIHHSEETINKIKKGNKKYYSIKENHPWYGKKHTEEQKKKISDGNKGKQHSDKTKFKMSESHKGKTLSEKTKTILSLNSPKFWLGKRLSEESKKRMRISKIKRMENLGIASCIDKGATDFFNKLNKQGYNFKPKRFMEIGYDADGYDDEKHIWAEYDTPYHNKLKQKEKDLIRQNNIIKYFESINKPLQEFIRIKDNWNGDIRLECVYRRI